MIYVSMKQSKLGNGQMCKNFKFDANVFLDFHFNKTTQSLMLFIMC